MQNESRTASRVYFTEAQGGLWWALFQPLNPKTGQPWQASRRIARWHDAHQLGNYKTGASSGTVLGPIPPFAVWSLTYTGAVTGYSTEALALAAIAAEKARSGK